VAGGRGNRYFCRRELINIVTPLRRPGSANTAASVCLYIGNKKDHCSQPRYVRADIKCANRPQCRPIVRWRACGLSYLASGWRSRPPVAFPACVSTRVPRHQRPGCCQPFHAPIPPATSTDCLATSNRGGGDSPARRPGPGGQWPLHFPGRAPPVPSPQPFRVRHCQLC